MMTILLKPLKNINGSWSTESWYLTQTRWNVSTGGHYSLYWVGTVSFSQVTKNLNWVSSFCKLIFPMILMWFRCQWLCKDKYHIKIIVPLMASRWSHSTRKNRLPSGWCKTNLNSEGFFYQNNDVKIQWLHFFIHYFQMSFSCNSIK